MRSRQILPSGEIPEVAQRRARPRVCPVRRRTRLRANIARRRACKTFR